jgi:hypothetical protein
MKALEFVGQLDANNAIAVPRDIAARIGQGQAIRVIMLLPEASEGEDWSRLTTEEFFKGYADTDAIYDDVSSR